MKPKTKFILWGCLGLALLAIIIVAAISLFLPRRKPAQNLPNLPESSQQLLDYKFLGYCFDLNNQTFYFSTPDQSSTLRKYSLVNQTEEIVNQFDNIQQISHLRCQKNFVIFKAQDLSVSETFAGQKVYAWKNFYYDLQNNKMRRLKDEIKSIQPLNENEVIYLYAGKAENYLAKTNFETNVTTKILDNFDGDNVELFPTGDQIYYSPLTSEAGDYTHLYLLKPKQKTDQQIDKLENVISVSQLDKKDFIFRQKNQAQLYNLSDHKFTPLETACPIAALKDKNTIYCADQAENNSVLSKISLPDLATQAYQFQGQILKLTNRGDKIFLLASDGLYRL